MVIDSYGGSFASAYVAVLRNRLLVAAESDAESSDADFDEIEVSTLEAEGLVTPQTSREAFKIDFTNDGDGDDAAEDGSKQSDSYAEPSKPSSSIERGASLDVRG